MIPYPSTTQPPEDHVTTDELIDTVARAYDHDEAPNNAALVRARHLQVVGPRTLRWPCGLLVSWMACGCVIEHRRRNIGFRISSCGPRDACALAAATTSARLAGEAAGLYSGAAA